ncbi:unnamed protein product [Cladocopium goreaui]|uniref:OTU domain-containing protein n=1 Tax=Cladocopium goreaui TaxID=2562237 RepID=A0A9P1FXV9_9DINO|nr:unnamed protein product [Cladocopium goreaui]
MADELPPEKTQEELEERHEREVQELEERSTQHVAQVTESAGKGKKGKQLIEAAQREVEQWDYDLREKHREELELLMDSLNGGPKDVATEEKPEVKVTEEDEAEKARRKKEKAQKKRQAKADKEAQREAEKEREKLEAGPSARDVELEALHGVLSVQKPPLKVLEIPSDGHCLYRSIADQVRRVRPDLCDYQGPADEMYREVRRICAKSLRGDMENYAPFAELKDGGDFEGYCQRVESSADWGGELELRALADAMKVRVQVFQAGSDQPLVLGAAVKAAPLQVSFHRHYYALGEHYNSVVPA